MPNFNLRLLNFPSERLFNPRKRLPGIIISPVLWKLIPFKEQQFKILDASTDCIQLLNYFNEFGFNNVNDFKEYINEDEVCSAFVYEIPDIDTERLLMTVNKYLFTCKRFLQYIVADDTAYSYHLPFLSEAVSDWNALIF